MSDANEVQLNHFEAEAFAQGLFALARADGLHEREAALVASFWSETGGSASALAELSRRAAPTAAELASALRGAEARRLFIKTALLLTWADGQVSKEEAVLIKDYAAALEISPAELAAAESEVKEYMLGHLSHIQNVDAVVEVAKKLAI